MCVLGIYVYSLRLLFAFVQTRAATSALVELCRRWIMDGAVKCVWLWFLQIVIPTRSTLGSWVSIQFQEWYCIFLYSENRCKFIVYVVHGMVRYLLPSPLPYFSFSGAECETLGILQVVLSCARVVLPNLPMAGSMQKDCGTTSFSGEKWMSLGKKTQSMSSKNQKTKLQWSTVIEIWNVQGFARGNHLQMVI